MKLFIQQRSLDAIKADLLKSIYELEKSVKISEDDKNNGLAQI